MKDLTNFKYLNVSIVQIFSEILLKYSGNIMYGVGYIINVIKEETFVFI